MRLYNADSTAKYANTLIGGDDLLLADVVAVRYMGFNPFKIKYIQYFLEKWNINIDEDIEVMKNNIRQESFFITTNRYKDFYVVDKWQEIKI